MYDDNWELINGPVAAEIEILNYSSQTNVLEGLVKFLLAHQGPKGDGNAPMPDEASLRHLHYAGTIFLLAAPGNYRNCPVHVGKKMPDGSLIVVHDPPQWHNVDGLMQQFFRDLSSLWGTGDALDVAGYALWRINWVHPFRNGNGRTARAFSYACMCLKLGAWLPGETTVPDLIMQDHNRARYEEVLKEADLGLAGPKRLPNLGPMKRFLDDLLQEQIASIYPTDPYVPPAPAT